MNTVHPVALASSNGREAPNKVRNKQTLCDEISQNSFRNRRVKKGEGMYPVEQKNWARGLSRAGHCAGGAGSTSRPVFLFNRVQSYLLFALDVIVVDLPDEGLVLVDAQLLEERLSHLQQHDESLEEIPHAQNLALGRL